MSASKERLTVTLDAEILRAGQEAIEQGEADSVSGWVNAALHEKVKRDRRLRELAAAVADYEAEFGEITPREIAAQRRSDSAQAVLPRVRHV